MPPAALAVSEASALRYSAQRLSRRLRRQAVADGGLSGPHLSALATVGRHTRLRLGDFARYEQVGKSTMTRLVATLETEGYLVRQVDPEDARGFVVELTRHGRDVLQAASQRQDSYLEAQLAALDPADRAAIRAAIPALERLLAIRA